MYDENTGTDAGTDLPPLDSLDDDMGSGGLKAWTHKVFAKAETIIPILLVILFLLFFAISFLNVNPNSIPLIGGFLGNLVGNQYTSILVIGDPKIENMDMFERDDFQLKYRVIYKEPDRLGRKPLNILNKYDIIILDQTESASKAIPDNLALAIQSYVKGGGSLVIVADSAYEKTNRKDVLGWIGLFTDAIAPVDCQANKDNIRPCQNPILVRGVLENVLPDNGVLSGVDRVPTNVNDGAYLMFTTFDINPLGDEWMVIRDLDNKKTYPGIVYKQAWLGKVVYFNYQELFLTTEIVDRVLTYLS